MATDKDFVVKNGIQVATTANVTGNINACSALTVAGITTLNNNVNVDSGTLFVDATNNRVGILNTTPDAALTITGSANISNDLRVGGILTIVGNTVTSGTQELTGNINPVGNIYFLGNTTNRWNLFGKNLVSDSSLSVGANVVVNTSTIQVGNSTVNFTITSTELNGYPAAYLNATTISTTLTVNTSINVGNSTVNTFVNSTSINVGSNVVVNTSTLRVGNSTSFANVTISGITTNGSLGVTGAATFANTIGTTGAATFSNTVGVTGATTLSNTLAVTGLSSLNGALNTTTANASIGVNVGNVSVNTTAVSVNAIGTTNGSVINSTTISVGNSTVNTSITGGSVNTNGTLTVFGAATLSNTLAVSGNATFSRDVTISGNLIINGTTTTVNTQTLNVADNIITLNSDISGATAPTENAGIEVNRGSSANVFVRWNETTDAWEITNDGTAYSNVVTVAYSGNADNITTGTLNTARLPATANISTALNVGANVNLTTTSINIGNSSVNVASNSSSFTVGTAVIANGSGVFTTGTVNAASHTVGSTFTANATLVNAAALNVVNQVNTATLYATTSANIASAVLANATGVYTTGVINAASHTVGATFTANTVGVTHTGFGNIGTSLAVGTTLSAGNTTVTGFVNATASVNSAILSVGTSFIANTTGAYHTGTVNAASFTVNTLGTTNGAIVNSTAIVLGNSTVNTFINSASIAVGTAFNANSTGVFHTGTVNAASHTVGANFTANSTLVNAAALNVVNQVNTATLYATTSANVGTAVVANSTGVYTTGTANAASFTINTDFIANTTGVYTTGEVNAASFEVGTNFIANTTTLVVANSTANVFAATSNGWVGIGNNSPLSKFSITSEATEGVFALAKHVDTAAGVQQSYRKSRGTASAPTLIANTDVLVTFTFSGYDGSNYTQAASITSVTDGGVSAGVVPGRLNFFTSNATGSSVERMRITSGGNVGISNTAPDATLAVTGTANVSGATYVGGIFTAGANVALNNNHIIAPTIKSYKEYTDTSTVTTAYTCNLANANIFTLTGTNGSNCVFTFSNPPASGTSQMFTVVFKQPATGFANVTWPATVKWSYGDTPVVSSTVNSRDVFTFMTFDGGTTYLGALSMANVAS